MPAGGGSGVDYQVMKALDSFADSQGFNLSATEINDIYTKLKQNEQNTGTGDRSIINDKGQISGWFAKDFLTRAQEVSAKNEGQGDGNPNNNSDFGTPPPDPNGPGDGGVSAYTKAARARAAAARAAQKFNNQTAFQSLLQQFGIGINGNMSALISQAVSKQYSSTTFLYYLRKTPEYRKAFPGIMKNGQLQMSEAQYLAQQKQYEDLASRYGLKVSDKMMGTLFKKDVSPSEFADRAGVLQQLKTNPEYYQQFKKTLGQMGLAKNVSKKELFKYVLTKNNPKWEKIENLLATRYAATQAGLKIQKGAEDYLSLNPAMIKRIARKGFTEEELQQGFATMEEGARTVLPTAEAGLYDVDKKDLKNIAFGGKGASLSKEQVERAVATNQDFYEGERGGATAGVGEDNEFRIYGGSTQGGAAR